MAEDDSGGCLKRRRKPSKKVLELHGEIERVKKPVKKTKPLSKALKPKSKPLVEEGNGISAFAGEVSDGY